MSGAAEEGTAGRRSCAAAPSEGREEVAADDAPRKIVHIDMDAFYASVEQRDDPTLAGRPLVVGGSPDGRGVVAACSYEARAFGLRSAMSCAKARRLCPEAVFVRPRFAVYREVSARIHEVFAEFTDRIEPLSLDEAYLDVSGVALCGGSASRMAREIKRRVRERTGLIASAGVSYNKFLAKIASDLDKPDGLYCIPPEAGEAFVARLPVGRIHGVGPVTEARMRALGIRTGADLRARSRAALAREFGKSHEFLYRAARGVDLRPVRVERRRKSLGAERTFSADLTEPAEMLATLGRLADEVLASLLARELAATTVTVKVRFADFTTLTRSHSVASGLLDRAALGRILPVLLERGLAARGGAGSVRLLGVTLGGLRAAAGARLPRQLEIGF